MLSYIQCFAFCVYVYLCVFILRKNISSWVNRLCAAVMASFALWAFGYIFAHNLHVPKNIATGFMHVAAVGWVAFALFFLWFTVVFTRRKIARSKIFYILTLIPTLVLIYIEWSGRLILELTKLYYGWGKVWTGTVWFYLFALYYFLFVTVSLYLMFDFRKNTKKVLEKKAVEVIFISTIFPLLIGSLTDVLLPKLGIRVIPNIGDLFIILWAFGLVYAIVRYKFMVLTPAMASEEIISTMADSFILISPESKILSVNKYTMDLLGYEENELVNYSVGKIFSHVNEGDITKKIGVKFGGVIGMDFGKGSEKKVIKDLNMVYKKKNGEEIPVSFSGAIMKDQYGNPLGTVGIAHDMRQMMKFVKNEKELAKTAAIKNAEHEKTEELGKAYDELKNVQTMLVQSEKLRALGQLGAGIAHELNSPLAGMLCLMRSYMKKKEKESIEYKDLSEMVDGCEFMAKIIKDLSDFTKETSDCYEAINMQDIIDSTLILINPELKKRRIELEKNFVNGLPLIKGERRQLQQVVLNMITNARDAIGTIGVIRITTKKIIEDGGMFVVISFEDSGCGMDEGTCEKIFDHFFTTKKNGKGVGLGLVIVKSIIDKHGGRIKVKTKPGEGTTFYFTFPVV